MFSNPIVLAIIGLGLVYFFNGGLGEQHPPQDLVAGIASEMAASAANGGRQVDPESVKCNLPNTLKGDLSCSITAIATNGTFGRLAVARPRSVAAVRMKNGDAPRYEIEVLVSDLRNELRRRNP